MREVAFVRNLGCREEICKALKSASREKEACREEMCKPLKSVSREREACREEMCKALKSVSRERRKHEPVPNRGRS